MNYIWFVNHYRTETNVAEKNGAQRIGEWIDEAGLYLVATEDGDQPKCRPMRAHFVVGDRIYFATGRFKSVYKQMSANPKVEIVSVKAGQFLRYWGKAVFEDNYDMAEAILDKVPQMRKVYTMEGDMTLEVFHLESAVAEVRSMMGVVESIEVE